MTNPTPKEIADRLATLIEKYQGWVEDGEVIRFPSVYLKEQFEKEWFS